MRIQASHLVIGAAALLSACTTAEVNEPQQSVGMANPASVYCAKVGGRVEIRKERDGEVGYCHLPDGRVIEEWTLFRSSQKQ